MELADGTGEEAGLPAARRCVDRLRCNTVRNDATCRGGSPTGQVARRSAASPMQLRARLRCILDLRKQRIRIRFSAVGLTSALMTRAPDGYLSTDLVSRVACTLLTSV